ncbi:hypothetical protein HN643_00650 [Candidatus Falkowbacteria bacterium]|nr:hypothetical protein [Candidatus Falkowbacteria bacterium]MBT6573696.1 hypothetical protein [Candidatus Falkowbacteria bacterium]MBT7500167.1 hypothetical protein [Candidatus Falkowbacteria bacterium]
MKNLGYAIMFVLFAVFSIGCGDEGGPQPGFSDTNIQEDAGVTIECSEHSDCFPDHKFCVKGTCVGEPQPECLPGEICGDVVVQPDNGPVENDIDVPELTDSDVSNVDCYSDTDCSYLENTACDEFGEWQMNITGSCVEGVCMASSLNVSECETGCMNGGCLPESSCNDDSICVETAGSYCTTDNMLVVYMATGSCEDSLCEGYVKTYACTGDCLSNECLECSSDTDCEDDDVCTSDQCVEGSCVKHSIDGCCNDDSECGTGGGCGCENDHWTCSGSNGSCVNNSCVQNVTSKYCDFGCGASGCNECAYDTDCGDSYCVCEGSNLECTGFSCDMGKCETGNSQLICLYGCENSQCNYGPQPECEADYECDDMDPCSTDTCVNGGCEHDVTSEVCLLCDDDNSCTYDIYKSNTDQCVHGYNMFANDCCDTYDCAATCSPDDVSFGLECDEFSVYDSLSCIDGTYQCCNGDEQCLVDSICIQGLCKYFECLNDSDCDDGNLDTGDICDYGKCFHILDECSTDWDCVDFNMCTDDVCIEGSCVNPIVSEFIGQFCGETEICQPDGSCSDPICTMNSDCDDGNPCTTNICSQGICVHEVFDCGSDQVCYPLNEQYFACGWPCTTNQECEDFSDNVCTVGLCNDNGYCKFSFDDGVACDDGNTCSTGNFCESGVCQPGIEVEPCCQSDDECTSLATCVGECVFNSLIVSCDSDQDCALDPICNDQYGGVYEFTGNCFVTGFCEMNLYEDPEWGDAEDCFDSQACADSSECELGGVCSKYVCFWIEGKPECVEHSDCDDGNPCTYDTCQEGSCDNYLNEGCVLCETDEDCAQAEPICIDGPPLFQYYTECMPSGKCNVDVDYCFNCQDNQCLDECTSDDECSFGQVCTDYYQCNWDGNLQCKFHCPEGMLYAVIWYGNGLESVVACEDEIWTFPSELYGSWGECHPTFKFNLLDSFPITNQTFYGQGNEAVLECNYSNLSENNLGQGLMEMSIPSICTCGTCSN